MATATRRIGSISIGSTVDNTNEAGPVAVASFPFLAGIAAVYVAYGQSHLAPLTRKDDPHTNRRAPQCRGVGRTLSVSFVD